MDGIVSNVSQASQPIGSDQLHELRNRMTVVKGIAQMLDRQVRRDDWQREMIVSRIDRLQDEIDTLQDLIDTFESSDDAAPSDPRKGPFH